MKTSVGYLITKQYAIWEEISTLELKQEMFVLSRILTIETHIHLMAF
jgi:hypothetical protein